MLIRPGSAWLTVCISINVSWTSKKKIGVSVIFLVGLL